MVRLLKALLMAAFAGPLAAVTPASSQTPWPQNQANLAAGNSSSAAKAVLPQDVFVSVGPEIPPDRARFLGKWQGWMCNNGATDVKAAIEKIDGSDVTAVWAFASTAGNFSSAQRAAAKFMNGEIQTPLKDGSRTAVRLRSDGNLDLVWSLDSKNTRSCSGVLSPLNTQATASAQSAARVDRYLSELLPPATPIVVRWAKPVVYGLQGLDNQNSATLRRQMIEIADLTSAKVTEDPTLRTANLLFIFLNSPSEIAQETLPYLRSGQETESELRARVESSFKAGCYRHASFQGPSGVPPFSKTYVIHLVNLQVFDKEKLPSLMPKLAMSSFAEMISVDPEIPSVAARGPTGPVDLTVLDREFLRAFYSADIARGTPLANAKKDLVAKIAARLAR